MIMIIILEMAEMAVRRNFSAKRDAIYQMLLSTDTHPSAEWIYQQLKQVIPDLSLGTVYRNLVLFKEMELINSVGVVGGYERFDALMTPHAHFICKGCGRIFNVPGGNSIIDKSLCGRIEMECNVRVEWQTVNFTGTCEHCLILEQDVM